MPHANSRTRDFAEQVLLQHGLCFYCEKPMVAAEDGSGFQVPNQATRDHYIAQSNRGHRIVVAACRRCNGIKGHMNAETFKWAIDRLLLNPDINAAWHRDLPGMDRILFRIVRIEVWKEKQKKQYNRYREERIKTETAAVFTLVAKLKPGSS
jgi:hypothetical protein